MDHAADRPADDDHGGPPCGPVPPSPGPLPGFSGPRPRILHVSKVPPSASGVARHARALSRALGLVGDVETVDITLSPTGSQRMTRIVSTALRVGLRAWSFRPSLLVFDLSGRGLAEFYSACLAIGSIGRPVWLVVHDAPELVGPPLLLKGLDRRGGRRLGMYLSRTVGARLETWMMGRADTVFALSGLGAAALRERTGDRVRVRQLPIPIEDQSESDKQPIVYCPSSVSAVDVVPVVRALASASSSWTLRLGNMDGPEQAAVEAAADRAGILDRLEFIGRVDEVRLDESYEDAAVVVRNRGPGSSPENWAAVSGPVISAMAAGCAVIATDARGSSACLEAAGGVDLGDRPDDLERDLGRLLGDEGERARLGEAGRRHVRGFHTPERVARHLADAWAHTAERLSPRAT